MLYHRQVSLTLRDILFFSTQSVAVPRAAMDKDEGSSKSDELSSSSSSSEGGKMEAADEGRYAEDIPQAELSQSLHQSEVSFEKLLYGWGR